MRLYYGWVIVATLFLVSLVSAASVGFTFGLFVLPMGTELGLSRAALGWTQTARLGANGVSSLILGPLIDRYGTRLLIPVAGVVSAAALWIMSETSAYWVILLMFGLLGVVEFHFPGNLLTTVPVPKWFVRKRGKAAAITAAGIAGGAIVFALTHQYLLDSVGWRETFRLSAIIILVGTVPLPLLLLRRTPEDIGLLPDGESLPLAHAEPRVDDQPAWSRHDAVRTLTMWKIVAAYSLTNLAAGSFMIHRAPFWAEQDISTSLIATVFAIDATMFAAATLLTGAFGGRIAPRYLAAIAMAAQGLGIIIATLWVSIPTMFLSSPLLGGGAGINAVVITVIWADYYGRPSLGAIRAVTIPVILLGFAIGPPAIGALYALSGNTYVPGFTLLAGLLAAAAFIVATATHPQRG
jgi:sugar phosphate permease